MGSDTVSVDHMSIKVYWAIAGQTIDNEGTILDGTLPEQAACGPQFMDLNQVVINEFVPNVPDTGIGGDSGFEVPTSIHSPNDWDTRTVGNIQTSNDSYVNDNDEDQQGYSSFGFGIPTSAIINGLEVQIETRSSDPSGCQVGVNLSWNNGSSYATQKNQNLSGSDTIYTLGSL